MLNIGKFIARIRRRLLMERIEWEIYHRIFPHLNRTADHGYSFLSNGELIDQNVQGLFKATQLCIDFEHAAAKMPMAYGQAFRHIAYADITARMEIYIRLAKQREYQEVANVAPASAIA